MEKVHFIGIGGIGLSAIARFLKEKGCIISGSDIKQSGITKELENEGINITIPHKAKNIKDQDIIIYSAAIKEDNIELKEARKKNKICLSRKEALPLILDNKKVFAVAGAHGKSTTSAMLASLIEGTVIIGAVSKQFGSNMLYREGENVIFEADESDESFLSSNPYAAIVTNAEPEHMEYYNYDLKRFYGAYETFLNKAKIRVINAEDEFLSTLKDLDAIRLYPSLDIKNIQIVTKNSLPYSSFTLKDLGKFEVFGIGEHIVMDASLAILAALHENTLPSVQLKLKNYGGIKKRFDILQNTPKFALIDDYAHHPTEIKATLQSARIYANLMGYKKITAIWQPHKYSRTIDNLAQFKQCFKEADKLVILPVYSCGQEKQEINFKEEFKQYNPIFADFVKAKEEKILLSNNNTIDSDLVIGFGAGDITYQLRGQI